MNFAVQTILNLFLVVSLAVMPLSAALAAINAGNNIAMHSTADAEPCHDVMQDKIPNSSQQIHPDSSMTGPCDCCGTDCGCPDSAGCHGVVTLLVTALPRQPMAVSLQARDIFAATVKNDYLNCYLSPESHPPIV